MEPFSTRCWQKKIAGYSLRVAYNFRLSSVGDVADAGYKRNSFALWRGHQSLFRLQKLRRQSFIIGISCLSFSFRDGNENGMMNIAFRHDVLFKSTP